VGIKSRNSQHFKAFLENRRWKSNEDRSMGTCPGPQRNDDRDLAHAEIHADGWAQDDY
jgi:hypothetical protein